MMKSPVAAVLSTHPQHAVQHHCMCADLIICLGFMLSQVFNYPVLMPSLTFFLCGIPVVLISSIDFLKNFQFQQFFRDR
jgi:hypothetical protein